MSARRCARRDAGRRNAYARSRKTTRNKETLVTVAEKSLIDEAKRIGLDLSDVDGRVGQWVGGGEMWEPCSRLDIRRWVHAMDYANPVHWDEDFARASEFGGIVAPQSFSICMDYGHGMHPALVGRIDDAHMILGSEEWWYSGYRIRPGDHILQKRRFDGYDLKDSAFAGPTVFARGDTFHYTEATNTPIAHCRTTAIRYSADEADRRGIYKASSGGGPKKWTDDELAEVNRVRFDWILSNREGITPSIGDIKVGDALPRRALGPHSIASFVTEFRSFPFGIWGGHGWSAPSDVVDPWVAQDTGTIKGMAFDREAAKLDPRFTDSIYFGPAAGHVNSVKAEAVGMGRAYGYGASMSAWAADYVSYWAGNHGAIRHSKISVRGPAFEGDVTYCDAEVVAKEELSPLLGVPLVTLKVKLSNQDGNTIVVATVEVEVGF
jgi:acyl dehydratase